MVGGDPGMEMVGGDPGMETVGGDPHEQSLCAWAPGRVNLMGDHTDYNQGLALPVAIGMGTRACMSYGKTTGVSENSDMSPLQVTSDAQVDPSWTGFVEALATILRRLPDTHIRTCGTVSTTLPIGKGLSSSASLEASLALAMGLRGNKRSLATVCQKTEWMATGVECGLLDQIAVVFGKQGHCMFVDFSGKFPDVQYVSLPEGIGLSIVDTGTSRSLQNVAYNDRQSECRKASELVGPLGNLVPGDLGAVKNALLDHPQLFKRVRHVITENHRVRQLCESFSTGRFDTKVISETFALSHRSLSGDYEVSLKVIDDLVVAIESLDGVAGCRMTGAGFGGCLIVAHDKHRVPDFGRIGSLEWWQVETSDGARVLT